jgi:hypothetical protein
MKGAKRQAPSAGKLPVASNAPPSAARADAATPGTVRLPGWMMARRYEFAALLLYAFILVVRAPWILFVGRIWSEEGTIFLQYAWTHSFLDALTAPHAGYYNLVANLAGIVAAHVPLETAPCFTALLSLLVQTIPAAALLFASIPGLETLGRKGIALLLMLAVPANPEVYLISINEHFVLCVATGLVLISNGGGRFDRLCKLLVLLVGGLSGVVSTFLAPFFWLRWWRERRRDILIQASILTACALLQFIFISQSVGGEERKVMFSPTVMVGAAYAKILVTPLVPGPQAARHLEGLRDELAQTDALPFWVWLSTMAVFAALVWLCWRSRNRNATILALATIWMIVLASPGSRFAGTVQKLADHLPFAMRYYYAAQVFFFLALLIAVGSNTCLPRAWRAFGGVWLGAVVVMGLVNFARAPLDWPMFFFGPPWAAQVRQWHEDPTKPLALWPAGREVTLSPRP